MIQDVINGIISAIRTEYDKTFRIYTESIEQGFKEPCFSILSLNNMDEQKVGMRHNRTYPFIVRYFPKNESEPIQECQEVMENLYSLLEVIDIGSVKIRGKDMSGKVTDGILLFEVTYAGFILAAKSETLMETLEVKNDGSN